MRVSLEGEPPLLETGELSDKNATSQRAVLQRRRETVKALHAPTLSASLLEARRL